MSDNREYEPQQTDAQHLSSLLQARFHGAVNIRGIRYQILYSLVVAMRLYEDGHAQDAVRLEGLEDIDLLGLHTADEYIQVKTADSPWNWAKLKQPVAGFLDVLRTEAHSQFVLAVNFSLRDDIAKLALLPTLPTSHQASLNKKFRKLCREVGGDDTEADRLIKQLRIVSLPEEQLWQDLTRSVATEWQLASEAVGTYIAVLVNTFLDWAARRATITRSDLERVRAKVGEALSREAEFQAYGSGLINRLSWQHDNNLADFFDAKGTRPAHIAAGLDVVRSTWLTKIEQAVNASKVCILRASSGQGKTALAYRFAYNVWPHDETFVLRVAQTHEQVELVRNFLEFRTQAGLPTYLLVDDAGYQTQLWPVVAESCSAMGIPIVVTVRNEDWIRFARHTALRYEVLDPALERDEAHQIFENLQAVNKLHSSVDSAEWAYERVGEPHLLIEYIYLLTHGQMLEDRLRDQVVQFHRLNEDPAKTEIVRRVSLADTLGAPVQARELLRSLPVSVDVQQLLQAIRGEYVELEDGMLKGLHWVRSQHLAAILHESYPDQADTALSLVPAIPLEYLGPFVANALTRLGLDEEFFFHGLAQQCVTMTTLLSVLNGVFEAGERQFLEANRDVFDQAYELSGPTGAYLLGTAFMPVVKIDAIGDMAQLLGEQPNNFQELVKLSERVQAVPRGLDLCRNFLERIVGRLSAATFLDDLGQAGRFLDWSALAAVSFPMWACIRHAIVTNPSLIFQLSLNSFCALAQGWYQYDAATYEQWFTEHHETILKYLQLHTDSLSISVDNNMVSVTFLVESTNTSDANSQVMTRLHAVRSALAFCDRYKGHGEWILPLGLQPTYGGAEKDIPKENLHHASDVDKNVVWTRTVEARYRPDSYYRYEEAWYYLRSDALLFVEALSTGLQQTLVGKTFDYQKAFQDGDLLPRLAHRLKDSPEPPPQMEKSLSQMLKGSAGRWEVHFQTFFTQLVRYIGDRNDHDARRLTLVNFGEVVAHLSDMQHAFAQLNTLAADYFGASSLVARERKAYAVLGELLEAWIEDASPIATRDVLRYLQLKRDREQQDRLRLLSRIIRPLQDEGIEIILPSVVVFTHPLRQLAIAFSVANVCHPEHELEVVVEALSTVRETADFFWLVPMHEGVRPIREGYQLSARQLEAWERGEAPNWETLVPHEVPDDLVASLPTLPYRPFPGSSIRATIFAVLLALPMLAVRRRVIERLRVSESPYDVELVQRHTTKIEKATDEIIEVVHAAKNELESELGHHSGSPYLSVIATFLDTFERPTGQRPVDEGYEPPAAMLEQVVQAIEVLCCGASK
jgi:hypothetical protein